jgi:hypothetical protein
MRPERKIMSAEAEILSELEAIRLIDPHTHINPYSPASRTLADILGITTTPNWLIQQVSPVSELSRKDWIQKRK